MMGMKFKSFPHMGTWLFCASFLFATLWHSVFRDGWGFLLSMLFMLAMLLFASASLLIVLGDWSMLALRRLLIILTTIGAFVPMMAFGGFVRVHLFLAELPRFQRITDAMIASGSTHFPDGYTNPLIGEHAIIDHGPNNSVTVLYFTRDSSAVGHAGFLYRSDDNMKLLKAEFPDSGFRRVAPKWFEWGD